MSHCFKVIIVSGGPVGLVAAHALHLASIDFVLLERRNVLAADVGASLVLGAPTLRVMYQLNLLDALMEIGVELRRTASFELNGYKFADSTRLFRHMRENHGTAPVAFHRAELIQTIYNCLPDDAKSRVVLGKAVVDITTDKDGVEVTCADGTNYAGSMVIGADGVNRKTRRVMRRLALCSNPDSDWDAEFPYLSTYRCLWASFPRASEGGQAFNTQHKNRSVMYISGKERSWIFAYEKLENPTNVPCVYSQTEMNEYAKVFEEFPVTDTLKVKDVLSTSLTSGMANLEEGIANQWSWGRIVLVGDACHKFTPNAGLGFQNGVQDVVSLCNRLRKTVVAETPHGVLDVARLAEVFQSHKDTRFSALRTDASTSAKSTRAQAWANTWYYLIARYAMGLEVSEYLIANYLLPNITRSTLILDYVAGEEPFVGLFDWKNEMASK